MNQRLRVFLEACVILAALATIPVVLLDAREVPPRWLTLADWTIWSIFAASLGLGTLYAEDRGRYVRRHPVDVAVVLLSFPLLPSLLALARLARIVRVLRVAAVAARALPALKATLGRSELLYAASICVILVLGSAVVLVVLEPETVGGSFTNALWWSAVTVTTVGYGDIAPASLSGRLAAIVIMLAGLGVISTFSASIAAYFVDQGKQSHLSEIEERLKRIEALLEREHTVTRG